MRQTLSETAHLLLHLIASQQTLLLLHTLSKRLVVVAERAAAGLVVTLRAILFIPRGLLIRLLLERVGLETSGRRGLTVTTRRYLV
jgi:hypothetical protein